MTVATPTSVDRLADQRVRPSWVARDALAIAQRNLIAMFRVPTTLVLSTIQPVIFILMFRYVFGGAFHIPGYHYVDFLMPGVFALTVTFGSTNTGIGLADDLQKGLIERFRSLPMARSAVLAGRTLADLARNTLVVIIMIVCGFIVGFRVQTNVFEFVAAVGLMLLFGLALSWVMAYVGLLTRNAEAAQAASFPLLVVLVFASDGFVPTSTMPGWLQLYANHQPVTALCDAVRALLHGGPTAGHVIAAVAWAIGIAVVFAPLAVRTYRRTA